MEDKVEGTLITLTDDCLRAVCLHLDTLADIFSFSKVSCQFRQAALYGLSHMSLTLAIENGNCKCGEEQTRVWTYVLRDMANNSFTVVKPFAMQQNTALVQGVRRIEIRQAICKPENAEQFTVLRGLLIQFTAVTYFSWYNPILHTYDPLGQFTASSACAGRSPTTMLFELCEPFFPNLLSLQISSHCFEFDDNDQECFCNAVCAMPKLVNVSLNGCLYCKGVIKLTEKLQSRNASNVFSAFKAFNLRGDFDSNGACMSDIIKAITLYSNVEEVDIPFTGCPSPNKRVDFTPFQNLSKLKSFSTSIGLWAMSDLDLIYLIPANLTIADLTLHFNTACARFSVGAQFLNACSSLKVFKLSQPSIFDYDDDTGVDACTFPQFLTAFESHRNLTNLDFEYVGPDDHMPTKEDYEHIHVHFVELATRAPESLNRMHLALTPYDEMTVNEEMTRWASVVKASRTPTVHITFGLDFELGLTAELTSAMEQSFANELIVNVELTPKHDTMERAGTLPPVDPPLHHPCIINGTRQGSSDSFRIEVMEDWRRGYLMDYYKQYPEEAIEHGAVEYMPSSA